jgi:hypothetical protein
MAGLAEWVGGIRRQLDDLEHRDLVTTTAHKCPGIKEKVQQIRQSVREIKEILEKSTKSGTRVDR